MPYLIALLAGAFRFWLSTRMDRSTDEQEEDVGYEAGDAHIYQQGLHHG